MEQQIVKNLRPYLDKTIEYLKSELTGLQVGRATPGLLENLEVEAYGQIMPLKQLASIQTPEPRMILVCPWDKAITSQIEKAIGQSKLGLTPSVNDDSIQLKVPPLSEERRKELVKIVHEKAEESKISVRRRREEVWRQIQDMEQQKEIREDDKFRAKNELQELVDEYNDKIDEIRKRKEDEIMKV